MIYIHIPYCRSFCTYCDFYSVIPQCGYGRFADAVCAEIGAREEEIRASVSHARTDNVSSCGPNTLYMGGGTPSVMPAETVGRIVAACRKALSGMEECSCGGGPFEEFTVEVNPDDIVQKGHGYVEALLGLGVTRVSMGVQSLDDRALKWMNRRHDASSARKAYRILKESGVENTGIDLIFGYDAGSIVLPDGIAWNGQDAEKYWSGMIEAVLDISGDGSLPKHVSAYQLSIEDGSVLAGMVRDGSYSEPPEEECARQYDRLCGILASAGYHHYEISNFALPGYESRHNSAYWRHVPYVGIGPAAHSLSFCGGCEVASAAASGLSPDAGKGGLWRRSWNAADVDAYIAAASSGDWNGIRESESLTREQYREEEIMLGLRTDRGVPVSLLSGNPDSAENTEKLLRAGALVPVGGVFSDKGGSAQEPRLRIPEDRFFVSDDIIAGLL